jgi:hypothetical protein
MEAKGNTMNRRRNLIPFWLLCAVMLPAMARAQFLYTTTDGTITVTAYTGPPTNAVTIPDMIDGMPVTGIGNNLFNGATGLKSVTLPESLNSIGDGAFGGCQAMTNCNIPASVTSIGNGAFGDDYGLTLVTIGNSITNIGTIGNNAFQDCTNLTSVTIGNSVTSLGIQAFFNCTRLTSVTIGNGVTNIGTLEFEYCYNLTSITIGDSVSSIGQDAFSECFSLTNITIPASVTSIGDNAFYADFGLRNVTIPDAVTNMAQYAFGECTNLTGIYFQGSAPASLGAYVFFYDNNATAYYLPGTTGWNPTPFTNNYYPATVPTVLWNPQVQNDASFGVQNNVFGFNITGTSNIVVIVEACTNLTNPVWLPVSTNTLNTFLGTNGISYFSDPQWTNYSYRFYGFSWP